MSKAPIDALRFRGALTGQTLIAVNDRGDMEPGLLSGGCVPELLVDDDSGEILFDDDTGDVLYDDSACVGGGDCGCAEALDDLTDVVLTGPTLGELLRFDGAAWVNVPAVAVADAAAGTLYVATTGSDTTGDGSSGNPYATVTKALSTLPRSLGFLQTIAVADGTYAEALSFLDFVCTGAGKIVITGNPTTPANVTFSGTASRTIHGVSYSATVQIGGPVVVELEGVRTNATATLGVLATDGASLIVDRCTVTGTLTGGIAVWDHSRLELHGNITVSGFTGHAGVQLGRGSVGTYVTAGTLTITGSGAGSWGFQCFQGSSFGIYSSAAAGLHITITEVQIGFQIGLTSSFTHQGPSATLTVDNVSTPGSSAGIQCTDNSNWSMSGTSKTLVLDHLSIGVDLNSISYTEVVGTRTYTNLGATSAVTQNSVYFAP